MTDPTLDFDADFDADIARGVLDLLGQRMPTASICPSEVARALAADAQNTQDTQAWRALMPAVRRVAADLARAGYVSMTRGDAALHPDAIGRGPIRLRRGPRFTEPFVSANT